MLRKSVLFLSLSFLFLQSRASAQSPIQVTSATTTRLPIPGNNCTAPPTETNFLTTDARVWVVFSYNGGAAGDTGFVEWFDPSGNLYFTSTVQQTTTGGTSCYGFFINVYGFTPANEPGNWRVRLRWNNTEIFSKPFTIAAPTSSTLALVSDTTLPQATVGTPFSFTFQASGGTAPYQWSLLSGGAPPGLTLSAGGVLSGTPTSAASYLLRLHVADSAGHTLDRDVALAVGLPELQIGVGSLAFSFTQGGAAPKSQSFALTSSGGALPFTASVDQSWLSITPGSGSTPGNITVSVQPQNLVPGSYQGNVTIQSSGSSTPSHTVPVSLAVLASGTGAPGGIIRTVAGTDFTFSIANGQAKNAPLSIVFDIASDAAGNVYAADAINGVVIRIDPNGTASVVAGNGLATFSGDGGSAVNASLYVPAAVAVDASGNLYLADAANSRIRRVSADGRITTIAGTGVASFGGDGGPAVNALLNFPTAIAVDPAGDVFFFDSGNQRIRKISPAGQISTVVGVGASGTANTAIDVPDQITTDSAGNLYFGDGQSRVLKLTSSGQLIVVAGTGTSGFSGDNGPATKAQLRTADGLAVDASGNLYIGDYNNGRIRMVDTNGVITTIAGSGDIRTSGDGGAALRAGMNPNALAVDAAGNLYLADAYSKTIRKIDLAHTITAIAGNGQYRSAPDGTPALAAYFNSPMGLAIDRSGNLIVADSSASRVRMVSPAGVFTTLAGSGAPGCCTDGGSPTQALLDSPSSVAIDSRGQVYFADSGNHRIRRINSDGTIATFAGAGADLLPPSYDGDGKAATSAHLNNPNGLAFDAGGNLYIADTGNNVVRKVDTGGIITTFAGTGTAGFAGDGTAATKALLNQPYAVAVDNAGNVYVADTGNHSIRMVTPGGTIFTVAGNQKAGFSGDGGPARNASLNKPEGLTFDPTGNLYVLEYGGNRIRQINTSATPPIITTVAGTGAPGFSGDGGPSPAAQLNSPVGSMAYQNGTLYFTDTGNQRVRAIGLAPTSPSVPSLSVSPTSLTLKGVSGGSATSIVSANVTSSSAGLPVQIAVSTNTGGAWLQIDTTSATLPAKIGISANPVGLAAGTYQGTVTIVSPYASPSQVTIAVTFTVAAAAAGHLSTDTTPLSFKVLSGASPITAQIALSNSGSGSLAYSAATATAVGGNWLAVTPSSGTVSSAGPTALTVSLNPAGLAAGVYSGSITLSSPDNSDAPLVVPVTLLVGNPVPIVLLSQTGLTFQAVQGGGSPLPQDIEILNVGQGSMNWTATAQTLSGSGWLSISPASGSVATPFVSFSTATISVNPAGLAAGNYFGQITVRAAGANAPQTLSVVLNVYGAGTPLPPEIRPSGLVFIGSKDAPPGSQTVSLANSGTAPFGFNSNKLTLSNINWITNAPVSGNLQSGAPVKMTVQPDLSQRQPGVDRGVITILFNDGSSQTVNLLSVVPPPGFSPNATSNSNSGGLAPRASGGCNPQQLLGQITNPSSTSAPLGQPVSLELRLTDDCGNLVTDKYPASVNVAFSTGDPGLTMQPTGNGKWTRTWQPRGTQPATVQVQFTAFASAANGKVLGWQIPLTVNLIAAAPVPLVKPGGIQNAASYSTAPVVAPGALIAISGNGLSDPASQLPPSGNLPTSLGHTQVKMGDSLLPLLFTSGSQLNAQVPFDLPLNSQQQLVVQYGAQLSVPAQVSIAAAQPAIFTQNQQGTGQGAINNAVTGVLADSANPVHAGDIIAVYCTGLGPVSPAQPEGTVASMSFTSQTVTPVSAAIGGQSATVQFAGLAPGYIGLYQVNVQIPTGVTPGDNVPVVLTEGSQVSPPVTIAVR